VRRLYPHWKIDYIRDPQGRLESRSVDYHFIFELANSASTEWGVNTYRELLVRPFTINRRLNVVIPPGVYNFYEYLLMGNTDTSRRLFGNGRLLVGPFYTGYAHRYTASGTLRLSHQVNATVDVSHNNIHLPQGHFTTTLLTLRSNYSFSTRAFLNALIQYNTDARQWSSNIRFNLIHRPLSDVFLVYNERRDSASGALADRAVIAKITYMVAQ
jgi:hypothetical protein